MDLTQLSWHWADPRSKSNKFLTFDQQLKSDDKTDLDFFLLQVCQKV